MVGPIPTALGQRYAIGINDDPRAATGAAPSTGARRAPNMPWHLHTVYREAQQRGEDARLCEGVQCGVRRWCSALRATRRELNALALGTGEYTENKCQRATRTKISGTVCVCLGVLGRYIPNACRSKRQMSNRIQAGKTGAVLRPAQGFFRAPPREPSRLRGASHQHRAPTTQMHDLNKIDSWTSRRS